MYIPIWLIVVLAVVIYFIYRSRKKGDDASILERSTTTVEDIEGNIRYLKERLFSFEHFDSPHFIDVRDAFDAMEINYLRLKQRFSHDKEKTLEIVKDWHKYADSLTELKDARVMLDVDWSDDAFDNFRESNKEPSIIKEEVEKKFKSLLGEDWQDIPPDYFKKMETMKEPDKKTMAKYKLEDDWKYYYRGSANLSNLEKRRKEEKERKIEKKESEK